MKIQEAIFADGEDQVTQLTPCLYVVATPIGNLSDMSSRAKEALKEAEVVYCEDTRRTQQLLSALDLGKGVLERLDHHTAAPARLEKIAERILKSGGKFAYVSDAGTPGVSDPGARLVSDLRERGVRIIPIPGPSAVTAFVSVLGFEADSFCFRGFFPRKKSDQETELRWVMDSSKTSKQELVWIWFESPERVQKTFQFFLSTLGDEVDHLTWAVGKEMTKIHEKIMTGSLPKIVHELGEMEGRKELRGEWVIAMRQSLRKQLEPENSLWIKSLECLVECGVSPSEAAKKVSDKFNVKKKPVYEMALSLSGKK